MKLLTGFFVVMSMSALSLTAAQAASTENEYTCENAYMEVAYDCGKDAVEVEKKRLNKIYMGIYRTLDKHEKEQLDKEQIAWLKTRDKKCNFEHDGPMNNTVVYAMIGADVCIANETQKRSKVIAKRYNVK